MASLRALSLDLLFDIADNLNHHDLLQWVRTNSYFHDSLIKSLCRRAIDLRMLHTLPPEVLALDCTPVLIHPRSPLHWAAEVGNELVLTQLIDVGGLSVDACFEGSGTPLLHAAMRNRCNIVRLLLDRGADVNDGGAFQEMGHYPVLAAAVNNFSWETVEILMHIVGSKPGWGLPANVSQYDILRNILAIEWPSSSHPGARLGILKLLLTESSVTGTDLGRLLLEQLPEEEDTLRLLLRHGADITMTGKDGSTALHIAALHGRSWAIQALVEAGADVNARNHAGVTPLYEAASHGFYSKLPVQILLDAGAEVNIRTNAGYTPLHEAAAHAYRPSPLAILIEAGADVNALSPNSETPFHWLERVRCLNDIVDACEHFLKAGADPNIQDFRGRTPFHCAVDGHLFGVLAWLSSDDVYEAYVEKGGTPFTRDETYTPRRGISPLTLRRIQLFVDYGANMFIQDMNGKFPLSCSLSHAPLWSEKEVQIILELGAQRVH